MATLEKINFMSPKAHCGPAYQTLVTCWASGFLYAQAKEILRRKGYYLPEDQYRVFCQLLDIQLDLGIGERQEEVTHAA